MAEKALRKDLSPGGSFVAVPKAFEGVSDGVRSALKMEFRTSFSGDSSDPLLIRTTFAADRFMLDLGAVDVSGLEAEKIVRDCELVADAVRNNPERMRLMVEAQSKGDFQTARQIGNEIGLTEEQLIESGGGLALLILVAVIAFAASCEHCHASHEPHDRRSQLLAAHSPSAEAQPLSQKIRP